MNDLNSLTEALADKDTPRRGGNSWLGLYAGGAPLNSLYQLSDPEGIDTFYHCAHQLRNSKSLLAIESDLKKSSMDSSALKFNGKLKLSDPSSKELTKEEFLLAIDDCVTTYGMQTFFFMPHDSEMTNISENPHLSTVQQVIDHHVSRLSEPLAVIDTTSNEETAQSVLNRFKAYDKFERFDISMTRHIVSSLLSHDIQSTIRIKYGHLPNFKTLPGQVIMKMALDVSNASAVEDIEGAITNFAALKLATYPGENIVDFATEALRLIKIMNTGYALPYKTGSLLLSKVENTSSSYFNNKVMTYQDTVKAMERFIGPIKNPALMKHHGDYAQFGPMALCAKLQELYGELKHTNEWPAIVAVRPEGNNAEA